MRAIYRANYLTSPVFERALYLMAVSIRTSSGRMRDGFGRSARPNRDWHGVVEVRGRVILRHLPVRVVFGVVALYIIPESEKEGIARLVVLEDGRADGKTTKGLEERREFRVRLPVVPFSYGIT